MPIYDYQCKECQHHFTDMLKMDDRHQPCQAPCPNCQKDGTVETVLSAPSIILDNTKMNFYKKVPGQMKERLQEIKRNHKGSTIKV
jgi:putative FmdB family regulatory protein